MGFARGFLARSRDRFQRFDETPLRARSEVRVLVRALLGAMTELSLHSFDRLAARDRLARHRVPPQLVVAEQGNSWNDPYCRTLPGHDCLTWLSLYGLSSLSFAHIVVTSRLPSVRWPILLHMYPD